MILLLAGTAEARNLAGYLKDAGIACTASLAGATRNPADLPVPTRHGGFDVGFGGAAGFEAYLDAEGITAVIDATHPFAVNITARTAEICKARSLPYLRFERAVWRSRPGDTWHEAKTYRDLHGLIPEGSRVFWAAGRQALAELASCGPFAEREMICRVIDTPTEPFPVSPDGFTSGSWAVGRPPFSESDEIANFEALKPDWLVVKNAGGGAGRSKLDAARKLGIRVAMIARAEPPEGIERREQICDALEWAENLELAQDMSLAKA